MSTPDSLIERYLKETHSWIDTGSDFFVAFSAALRDQLNALQTSADGLQDWLKSGRPLRNLVRSWNIFFSESLSDGDLLRVLERVYEIHRQRGTVGGVDQDVAILLNYPANIYYYTDLEWYLGCTYPNQTEPIGPATKTPDGVGTDCIDVVPLPGRYNIVCFGLDSAIILQYFNDTQRTDREVERIIFEEFCPVRTAIELIPQTDAPADTLMFELGDPSFCW